MSENARKSGRIICQRPREKYCGLLREFPGGKIEPGVIPAWHMNKSQWIGFLLESDRSAAASEEKRERTAGASARDAQEAEPKATGDWLRPAADGTAEDETIRELLEISYDLTKGK